MPTILEKATLSMQMWNEARHNGAAVSNYFRQGAYFQISRDDYTLWNVQNPDSLHAYMGLVQEIGQTDFSLALFCVDSGTDALSVADHPDNFIINIKQSTYQKSVLPNAHFIFKKFPPAPIEPAIETIDALKACNQWILHKDNWLLEQTDMAQAFVIPFESLSVLFANDAVNSVIALPALKELDENSFEMTMILWGYTAEGLWANYPTDFINPAPPFSNPSNFQLFAYAIGS